jgi:hypothetical protein
MMKRHFPFLKRRSPFLKRHSSFRSEEHRCLGCGIGTPIADPAPGPWETGKYRDTRLGNLRRREAAEFDLCMRERWIGRWATWTIGPGTWQLGGASGDFLRVCGECQTRTVTTCRGCRREAPFSETRGERWWFAYPFAIASFREHRYTGEALCGACRVSDVPTGPDEMTCSCGTWEPNVGDRYPVCLECLILTNFGAY